MDKKIKQVWIKELRSGRWMQGTGSLAESDESKHVKYCCLGVLGAKVLKRKYEDYADGQMLDQDILDVCGLTDPQQCSLAGLNDDGNTFKEIADYIQKEL